MDEGLTNEQIATEIGAIEADLSVIMHFMRQLSDEGFAVEPDGVRVMEGMIFATNLRVSKLRDAVVDRLKELQEVVQAAGRFIEATEEDDAEIREMTGLLRRAAIFLHSPKDRQEADDALRMIRQGLVAIEQRTLGGDEAAPAANVVQLFSRPAPVAAAAPEGGAA